ncbi:MAG: phospholipid carrier-dependent glycosyltransferase [Candidatus Andersenbacteria bacterium]|nr:phospholipid carrier-dependent glycosyltransferase [Candidatus Andersenbacteria bacterium]
MNMRPPWIIGVVSLLVLTVATRVWRLADPPLAVFDETHYATLAAQYLSGRPFIFSHPPLAALHFAVLAWLGGASPSSQFIAPLTPYGDFPYVLLRAGSAAAGTLLVLFLMLAARETTHSDTVGLLVGFLAALDNTLILYSRLILPDTFLLFYGTAGLWFFLTASRQPYRRRGWYVRLIAASILFGFAGAVKVTGFIFPAAAFIYTVVFNHRRNYAIAIHLVRYLIILPVIIGIMLMLVHFLLLDPTGPVFLGADNISTTMLDPIRQNNPFYPEHYIIGRLTQRSAETAIGYLFTIGYHFTDVQHAIMSSRWWMWPYALKPIRLFSRAPDGAVHIMYLAANPIVWWSGLAALAYLIPRRIQPGRRGANIDLWLIGYFLYLLVMALIPRTMFLYHYLPALVFLLPVTALALAKLHAAQPLLSIIVLCSMAASYVYFSPYTYGLPLDLYWTPLVLGRG